jgi:peptide/nickel transport system ATP-binding protein
MPQTVPRQQPLNVVEGQVPDMIGGVTGCPFASRCEYATEECTSHDIEPQACGDERAAACCHLEQVPSEQPRRVEEP